MAARREEALAGTLIAYGLSLADMFRDTAVYVDKIFRGADRRPSRRAADEVRAGHQRQDDRGARPHDPRAVLLRVNEVIR